MRGRAAFSDAGRARSGARLTTSGARASVSPVAVEAKLHCSARSVNGGACKAYRAKGTPYCFGHARSLGVISVGDAE